MTKIRTISAQHTRIGWIGTGVMGQSICRNLMNAGFQLSLYTRTASKAAALLELGASWCDSPQTLAQQSDVIMCMVGYPHDVAAVILGDQGALNGATAGKIIIDLTTSTPQLAQQIFQRAQAQGVASLDAPVSGGDVGARHATLAIMVGGDKAVFESAAAIWQAIGKTITYMGQAGCGQHTKMVNQIAISSTMVAMTEALLYAHKAGLDLNTVLSAISQGAAGSWSLTNYAPRIIARNFDPGFYVEHFIKDLGIALDEAKRMQISLPGLALAHQLYVALQAQGHGQCGTHALMLALEQLNAHTVIV